MRYSREEYEKQWQQNFMIATQYYVEFLNLNVPFDKKYKKHPLGHWISRQRFLYNHGELSEEKIKALNSIGMIWSKYHKNDLPNDDPDDLTIERYRQEWMKYYYQFKESSIQSKELNEWLENQLILMEQKKLSEEREHLLVRANIYQTDIYYKYVRKAAREMFKNIIMYYRKHHTFPTEDSIPMRLDRSLDEWCVYFNHNIHGILSDKEYFIWRKIIEKRVIFDVKLKEKVLKP